MQKRVIHACSNAATNDTCQTVSKKFPHVVFVYHLQGIADLSIKISYVPHRKHMCCEVNSDNDVHINCVVYAGN